MSACETCWTEASRRALMLGGHAADHYREALARHPEGHDHDPHADWPTAFADAMREARALQGRPPVDPADDLAAYRAAPSLPNPLLKDA